MSDAKLFLRQAEAAQRAARYALGGIHAPQELETDLERAGVMLTGKQHEVLNDRLAFFRNERRRALEMYDGAMQQNADALHLG